MTLRIAKVAGWLAVGGAALAGLYWLFLNTPESNVLTLTASAALVLAMIAVSAATINTAVLVAQGGALARSIRTGFLRMHWPIVAAIPVIITWVVVSQADAWIAQHAGEIHAWFIAQFDWADVRPLFQAEAWISRWIRWVAVPIAALCLVVALLQTGPVALRRTDWIRRAWHWRTLALTTVIFFVLLAWPWQLTMWRPMLPPTWIQVAVAAVRLAIVAGLGLLGCALLVWLAATAGHSTDALMPTTHD